MSDERRRFFRIEDIVGLKTRVIKKQDVKQTLDSFWNDQHQFSIRNEFNYKLDQHQADLQQIKNKMPELGRYLSVLQEQLDLLTDKIVGNEDNFTTSETSVNISAQGISFISDEKVQPGDIVELNLLLLPNQQKIVVFAKVINCHQHENTSNQYNISLDFEHIHDADRELLVKHVHGKQLRSLGATRFEENS
ncbi:MAG: PilZ domain-containing protein [Gammaproteobacteria bacterium]|nr:PilZ domain-containing protein [Gammaproteobacteria bacterium]